MLQRIVKVVRYIDANLDTKITVDDLALAGGISRSRFTNLFKADTGLPPMQFVKRRRIERAGELLKTTSLSVRDIRSRVGFPDRSHFTREFKKRFGVTPVRYRKATGR